MKVIGAVLIISAFIYTGLIRIKSLGCRGTCLINVADSLSGIKNIIAYRNDPLPDLFRALSHEYTGQAGTFFRFLSENEKYIGEKSFSSIWNNGVKSAFLQLTDAELRELAKLGQILGRCDTEALIEAIEQCEYYINKTREQLLDELPQKKKLALGLSATAGAFAVILLI